MRLLTHSACVHRISLLCLLVRGAAAAPIRGPFQSTQRTNQMTTSHFYIHNASGSRLDVNVRCLSMRVRNPDWSAFPRLMVRVYDVDERPVYRGEITGPKLAEREGLAPDVSISVPQSRPGVVQVVVQGGRTPEATFDVTTSPALPFGVMNSIKVIAPPKDGIVEGVLFVPPGAKELRLEPFDADVTLRHESGVLRARASKTIKLPVRRAGAVWRMSVKPKRWPGAKVLTDGFPVILCPDEASARAIGGSIERLDDGTVIAHKFQVRLDRLVRKTFQSPEDFALPPVTSFEPMTEALLANPQRNRHLIVGYTPPLPYIQLYTQRQILDPTSPYFGGIHGPFKYGSMIARYRIPGSPLNSGKPPMAVPQATDEAAHDLWTAFSPWGYPAALAFIHNLDPKLSPYHGDRRLLNRVVIAACRDMMLVNESELVKGRPGDWMGTSAFVFRYQFTDAYGFVGQKVKELYPAIHREWSEGLMRYADRLTYMSVFAPANQAAHIPLGLWRVHQGSGDAYYREAVAYTAQRLCDVLQKPAGYQVEGYGPCGSYNGITLDLWAMLYLETGMPLFKESLRKAFHCFNHTVAPEPSGQLVGVTDLNHRVQMPWTYTQHGGGKLMMAAHMKEAGVWFRKKPTEADTAKLVESIRKRAKESPYSQERCAATLKRGARLANGGSMRFYQHYTPGVMEGGLFPYEEEPFLRNLGDEFICVKQPAYYCLVYVGKPGIPRRKRPAPTMVHGARTGGGISLLWTPAYGVAMAGQGWNAYCHHGLVVDMGKKRGKEIVRTADYFAVEFDLDEEARRLVVRGKVKDVPLRYRHTYHFAEDRISMETEAEADGEIAAESCGLQLPIFAAKERGFTCRIADAPVDRITMRDDTGASVDIRFAQAVPAAWGHTSKQKVYPIEYVIRQLKVALPRRWLKGQTWRLAYEIVAPSGPKR